ncbi:3-(methylthio)propionyl-CoA ligase [Noviherbaspirillum galbum]|uniref:Long-chain-fatty-acid--CoA ligase n=1 Tax=Noviherbaspirillum galbum TaxID=2709383 RepID=A0A6B3SSF4_9BURK|nr:3-(methylthio)propionyl-CoA ligase [Noviherbaspirillum galbum]NEX63687.1 long-chain-fatty-acid--CoA ligase [Noviherbaspirillum galbum]
MTHFVSNTIAGLMMNEPLLVSSIIRHADRHFGSNEIVSRRVEGDFHRYTYRDCHARTRKLANALAALGVQAGERVATLAWNGYRHMELYYGVSGSGSVIHTINPRLHSDQISFIANHAEDVCLFFEPGFLKQIEELAPRMTSVRHYVLMCDKGQMPEQTSISGLLCYEDLIDMHSDAYEWPVLDENAACGLCYTSGTTGNPKGVLYSHRSTVLHSYAAALPDSLAMSARDCVMPVVPMFHANAWSLPYTAPLTGAKLVFPGPHLDGKSVYELIEREKVTFSAGVPTVWKALLDYVEQNRLIFSTLERTIIGGSACPPAMIKTFRDQYNVDVLHGWGMTEMSPIGTVSTLQNKHFAMTPEEQLGVLGKQGHVLFGVDMKIVDDDGAELAWDGKTAGRLLVKGPWVIRDYFKHSGDDVLEDGWFPTGDVASITPDGYMQITDRSKDVIKSGGEWIGSIDIENIAMAHPDVALAACIGVPHPKWDERPLLLVVKKQGRAIGKADLLHFYQGKIAKWWTPDDVVFVDALPIGATGKVLKHEIRGQYASYPLPTA